VNFLRQPRPAEKITLAAAVRLTISAGSAARRIFFGGGSGGASRFRLAAAAGFGG